ncbi:MAG: alpha-amylase family glycosyl hydrolase [Bacteroidales bacterium]
MSNLYRIIISLFFAITWQTGFSQITSSPLLPTVNDEVVITFDATQGDGGLAGYTGNVYAHTGVIVEGDSNWQYVIGEWDDLDDKPQLTEIGEDLYEMSISPSILDFYGIPSGEVVEKLCFVFRGEETTSTPQSEDLFIDVVQDGLTVSINSPESNAPFYEHGETINISATANSSDELTLYINDTEITSTTEAQINFDYQTESYGKQWIKAVASYETDTAEDSVYFYVRNDVPTAELPEGLDPGVNYTGSDEVTLVLHDPPALKEFVFAIGDFSNWEVDDDYYMNRTPDGEFYWLTITDLDPDQEYIYQFWIDGEIKLADPYTEKISDPWNDHYISETNYPNLIDYPDGKTTGIASTFLINSEEYEWEVTDFTPPPAEELIIYELHIRDFVEDDFIGSVTEKLDYLEKLGVNAIELMPINEFEGNDSWGYNPSFYFAPDKAYGTKNDYKAFIDECHKRGIAVILDIVLNHSFNLSPFAQMYYDEEAGEYGKPSPDNPWFLVDCPHEPWCWGNTFDQDSPHTHSLFNSITEHWLTEYKFDGFRFDFTKGFTNVQTANQGSDYDAARIANLKRIADHVWDVNSNAHVILEHFTANDEEKELAEYGMLLWGNMNHSYNEASMGWIGDLNDDSNFEWVSYKQRGWTVPHVVGYMESHDEERLMFKNLEYGNSSNSNHNVKDLEIALDRQKLVGAFFFTIPGPKMIWQFGELGYDYSINHCPDGNIDLDCRTARKPVRWDYYEDSDRNELFRIWAELIALRNDLPVFKTDDFSLSLEGDGKVINLYHDEMDMVIVGNFDVMEVSVNANFSSTGTWYEYFSQTEVTIDEENQSFTLQPGEYRIYSNEFINRENYIVDAPLTYPDYSQGMGIKAWPNPTSGNLSIAIESAEEQNINIRIADINGRIISSVFQGKISAGEEMFQWSKPEKISAGVYFLLLNGDFGKMVERIVVY